MLRFCLASRWSRALVILTTRHYELTQHPDPLPNSLFQKFPSDYAAASDRWTGQTPRDALREISDANDMTRGGENMIGGVGQF
ncbi:hypothetical protein TcBrA4_0071700 [Trypanosoma cruzi]|nr:hypothetical protein TcBrA4_0071700 [Trypanosoma cruzi]